MIAGSDSNMPTVMGSSLPFVLADYGNCLSVTVAKGDSGVMAVMLGNSRPEDRGDTKRAFLLRIGWNGDRLEFDETWSFLSSPERLASVSHQGISIRCGENHQDLYYAPNPVRCLARDPKPGEKVITGDDACLFLAEKISKEELDQRIQREIEREDRMALLEQELREETRARHRDHEVFELNKLELVLERNRQHDKEMADQRRQLQADFDRKPLWRLAWQRFTAWRKEFRQKFTV